MGAVISYGRLVSPTESSSARIDALYGPDPFERLPYRGLYRSQPDVRVVVDFIARNIAQLGLNLHERVDDTDRRRDTTHEVIRTLNRPTPWLTRYRLIEQTVIDMAVMAHAYWVIVTAPKADRDDLLWLVPVPPERMRMLGDLAPTSYLYCPHGRDSEQDAVPLRRNGVVHFQYGDGTSPLETLRPVLMEARASQSYRSRLWKNDARLSGVIERPLEAPVWGTDARARWREQFDAKYTGAGNAGRVLILEEGMAWKSVTSSSRDAEWVAGAKLNREDVARAYHVPLPMVGILDHATFSNIKEQHRNLYQDSIGPWLESLTQDMELQLLQQFEEADGRYLEFNIQAKLAGSFEEQVNALQTSVGTPWVTTNEARGRMNLPSIEGGDSLARPLNMSGADAAGAPA